MSMSDALAFEAWQSLSLRERNNLLREAKKAKTKRRFNMALGAMAGGPWAIAGIANSLTNTFRGNYTPYQQFQKDDRPMPRAEIVRRKKKQIHYTEMNAATGLGGAGLVGAGFGAKKASHILPASKIAQSAAKHSKKLKIGGTVLFGAGPIVGGLSNINSTKIQQDDLKRHYASELKKGDNIMKAFDAEASRNRRAKGYTVGAGLAGAGVAGYSATKLEGKVAAHQKAKQGKYNKASGRVKGWNTRLSNLTEYRENLRAALPNPRVDPTVVLPKITQASARIDHLSNNKPPVPKAYKPLMKPSTAKKTGLAAGAALVGLGAVNEYHRRHGGKSY